MSTELEKVNSSLAKCLYVAFLSASREKKEQLARLLKETALNLEEALRNPIKIPSYLLMKISAVLGADQTIREIIMAYQFNRAIIARYN